MNCCGVTAMTEKEEKDFRLEIGFYQKWREGIIETDEQWGQFAVDVGKYVVEADCDHCMLAWHLLEALLDSFNDLYKGGMKPIPANYFGRADI